MMTARTRNSMTASALVTGALLTSLTAPCATAALTADTLQAGQVVVTELMIDPTKVSDANGEWFEMYNPFAMEIDPNGLVVESQTGSSLESFTVHGASSIQPGDYFVLGRNANPATNGGVTVDYAWGTALSFGNTADFLRISNPAGDMLAQISWTSAPSGKSLEMKTANLPSLTQGNYVPAGSTYGLGDFGTPGMTNTSPMTVNGLVAPPVPEPGTYALLGLGLGCVALSRRRRARGN